MIMGAYAAQQAMLTSTRTRVPPGRRRRRAPGTIPSNAPGLRGFGDEGSSAGGEGEDKGGSWLDLFTKVFEVGSKVIDRVVPWPPKGSGPTRVAPEGPSFNALPWVVGGAAVLGVGAVILTLKK